jgi:hypothetical protein
VNRSAFHIHTSQLVRRAEARGFVQQRTRLSRIGNVAPEQDDPCRPH